MLAHHALVVRVLHEGYVVAVDKERDLEGVTGHPEHVRTRVARAMKDGRRGAWSGGEAAGSMLLPPPATLLSPSYEAVEAASASVCAAPCGCAACDPTALRHLGHLNSRFGFLWLTCHPKSAPQHVIHCAGCNSACKLAMGSVPSSATAVIAASSSATAVITSLSNVSSDAVGLVVLSRSPRQ